MMKSRFRRSSTIADPYGPTTGQGIDETGAPNKSAAIGELIRPMPTGGFNPGWGIENPQSSPGPWKPGVGDDLTGDTRMDMPTVGPAGDIAESRSILQNATANKRGAASGVSGGGDSGMQKSASIAWDPSEGDPTSPNYKGNYSPGWTGPRYGPKADPKSNAPTPRAPGMSSGSPYGSSLMIPTNAMAQQPGMSDLLQGSPYERIMQALGGVGAGGRTNIDALIAELNQGFRL